MSPSPAHRKKKTAINADVGVCFLDSVRDLKTEINLDRSESSHRDQRYESDITKSTDLKTSPHEVPVIVSIVSLYFQI